METRADTSAALAPIAAALASEGDLEAVLRTLLRTAGATLGIRSAAVFVQDPDRSALELVAAYGIPDDQVVHFAAAVTSGQHPIAQAARTREAAWDRAVEATGGVAADLPLSVVRSGVDVPLGVVSFEWSAGTAGKADRTATNALASLIAVAIDHRRLASLVAERSEWFERMAHSDPLTGLANARTFGRVLDLEIARASRQSSELTVALFDVDDFAGLNAAAGHAAGDDVLRAVASVLAASVRLVDTVARFGGDEFVLVAPGSAGTAVAQRVVDGVRALPAVDGRPLSVSAGVARFPADGTSGDQLVATAQASLDRAKSGGGGSLAATNGSSAG
ncbi:MAG TPA: diguanylate cyclase [Candidatus Limnocylindrales bacterium]|nr:diguanylate cyclase [Candidatus Limnocylindrales bacterium]